MNVKELAVTTLFVIIAIAVLNAVATKMGLRGLKKLLPGG